MSIPQSAGGPITSRADLVAHIAAGSKPREEGRAGAAEIIARLQPKLAKINGIELYLQSVQDLQIDSRASRTQYQYTLEDAEPKELAAWAPRMLTSLQAVLSGYPVRAQT